MRIAIIAGEPSGDALGAALMRDLPASYFGIGGVAMQGAGLKSLFPMDELSVMGFAEILPRLPRLTQRIRETANYLIENEFDVLITIDSPDFCHRVAKRVRRARPNLSIIHYVAPSVWAWRAGRAAKMANHVDHVLCLLPFEPDYMRAAGMSADFVGHPVAKGFPVDIGDWQERHSDVLAVFPGSRRSEIKHHLPIYAEALKSVLTKVNIVIPTLPKFEDEVKATFPNARVLTTKLIPLAEFELEKKRLMQGAKLALATSGTVSLELAFAGCPTIVGYRSGLVNQFLIKRLVRTKWASLANILLEREVVPEYLFEDCTATKLERAINHALSQDDFAAKQQAAFAEMRAMMQPELSAAESVRRFLQSKVK